jgi:protein O-mannosyl-transferase
VMSVWTVWEQRFYSGALGREWDLAIAERIVISGKALWFYLGKLIWPQSLSFVYPRWSTAGALAWGPLIAAAGLLTWAALTRDSWARPAKFAAGYFVLLLFPVLGFFNVYFYRYAFVADHFQYLASMGPCALAGAALAAAAESRRGQWRIPIFAAAGAAGLAFAATTTARVPAFASDIAIWEDTLRSDPNCWMAHNNLAVALAHTPGREAEAVAHCQRALEINPENAEAQYNYATWLDRVERRGEAIGHYRIALRLNAAAARWHARLAEDLMRSPDTSDEGRREFREAARLEPNFADAHYNLGSALAERSQADPEAIAEFRRAIELRPDYAEAHLNLGNSYAASGRGSDAIAEYEAAVRARPSYANAHWALADALAQGLGEPAKALPHYAAALQNGRDDTRLRTNYAVALFKSGQRDEAIAQLQGALRLDPGNRIAQENLRALGARESP